MLKYALVDLAPGVGSELHSNKNKCNLRICLLGFSYGEDGGVGSSHADPQVLPDATSSRRSSKSSQGFPGVPSWGCVRYLKSTVDPAAMLVPGGCTTLFQRADGWLSTTAASTAAAAHTLLCLIGQDEPDQHTLLSTSQLM